MNNNIYPEYCSHGNPIYYTSFCPGCRAEKRKKREEYAEKYWEHKRINKLKKSKSQEELRKEYYKLAKKYHPDKPTGNTKLMQKLSQIYELLLRQFI